MNSVGWQHMEKERAESSADITPLHSIVPTPRAHIHAHTRTALLVPGAVDRKRSSADTSCDCSDAADCANDSTAWERWASISGG